MTVARRIHRRLHPVVQGVGNVICFFMMAFGFVYALHGIFTLQPVTALAGVGSVTTGYFVGHAAAWRPPLPPSRRVNEPLPPTSN